VPELRCHWGKDYRYSLPNCYVGYRTQRLPEGTFLADGNFAFPHRLLVCPNGEPRVRPGSGGEGGALSREKSVRFRVNDQIMAACRSG